MELPVQLPRDLLVACETGDVVRAKSILALTLPSEQSERQLMLKTVAIIAARLGDDKLLRLTFDCQYKLSMRELNDPLLHAANTGSSVAVFQVLLEHGIDLNKHVSEFDGDALVTAVNNGNLPLVQVLLQHGMDVNSRQCFGKIEAIIWTIIGPTPRPDIAAVLLDHGLALQGTGAVCAAADAGNLPFVKLLIENGGGNIEEATHWGLKKQRDRIGTPLYKAAAQGRVEVVKYLLSKGADPNYKDAVNRTPFVVASEMGHTETASLLG